MEINEKRQFERFKFKEPVRVQFKDPAKYQGSLSRNMSQGGVQLTVDEFIGLNEELSLNIQSEKEIAQQRLGRVVWVEQIPHMDRYRVGIQFSDDVSS